MKKGDITLREMEKNLAQIYHENANGRGYNLKGDGAKLGSNLS